MKNKIKSIIYGNVYEVGRGNKIEREKWLESILARIPAGSRILDAGAGELQYRKFCDHLSYVSQDFNQYDGMGDKIGLQTKSWDQNHLDIISDITAIPEPDSSFDAVMCIEVLEHLPNPIKALNEMVRLIKSGGFLIITAPFCSLTHFSPYFYQTGYSRNFYEYWLPKIGVEILDIQFNGNFFEYIAQELNRLPAIAQKYSNDKLTILEKRSVFQLQKALFRFSKKDKGSSEFLSFGLHVFGKKK